MQPRSLHNLALRTITDHFAAFSALAVACGFLISTIFVYAYLSVFDWHLIWLVDSGDLLKFAIVGVGVLSLSSFVLVNGLDLFRSILSFEGKTRWFVSAGILVLFAFLFALLFLQDSRSSAPKWATHWSAVGVTAALGVIFFRARNWLLAIQTRYLRDKLADVADVEVATFPDSKAVVLDVALICFLVALLGVLVGNMAKESTGFHVNVTLDGEQLRGVGFVMLTANHGVFFSDSDIIVVPSARVQKIESGETVR